MRDEHKLQLAIYRLLLFGEDQLFIFKGEKEMACKERSEHECKSYPNCEGCGAHTTEINTIGKNLTKTIYHPYFKREAAVFERDDKKWGEHVLTRKPGNGPEYLAGPVVDRLHEFENLGYEPKDLKRIIERHHEMNRYSRDAFDTLWYTYKKAGDIENALCDDIRDMWPSTLFTKEGFIKRYVESDEYRKGVTERIERVLGKMTPLKDIINEKIVNEITKPFDIARPIDCPKVWVTTSSSVKDDDFIKKVKEVAENINWPKKNPYLDFEHQFTATFKVADLNRPNKNGVILDEKVFANAVLTMPIYKTNKEKKENMSVIKKSGDRPCGWGVPGINRVIFNNPATIVFWADGDKTVVKAQNGEPYDPEKGLAMAISKKALGNDRTYYNTFAKHCKNKASEVANVSDLHDMMEDNKTYRALAADAIDYLKEVVSDPHATKINMAHAMNHAMECLKAILED